LRCTRTINIFKEICVVVLFAAVVHLHFMIKIAETGIVKEEFEQISRRTGATKIIDDRKKYILHSHTHTHNLNIRIIE
jgi:hypothetical protein